MIMPALPSAGWVCPAKVMVPPSLTGFSRAIFSASLAKTPSSPANITGAFLPLGPGASKGNSMHFSWKVPALPRLQGLLILLAAAQDHLVLLRR